MQINFFKAKKNFKKKNLELNPDFYWKLIICLVISLALLSLGFGYYVFTKVKQESSLLDENSSKKQTIDRERLAQVLEYFSNREKKSEQILNSYSPVVDPSL